MTGTIIIGYGNLDREDDGVAWHVLANIAERLGRPVDAADPDAQDIFEPDGSDPDLMFRLQLVPEMAELIAGYDRVCFVDAHTGSVPQDLNVVRLDSQFQASPFTHHMTPATLLSFAETLYNAHPDAMLVSMRGYRFGFGRDLSQQTSALAIEAADYIYHWLTP